MHTVITPQPNYLFITTKGICPVPWGTSILVVPPTVLPFIRADRLRAPCTEPLASLLRVGMNFPATFIHAVGERHLGKRNFRAIYMRTFARFSELSWEGCFILAIIILRNLI